MPKLAGPVLIALLSLTCATTNISHLPDCESIERLPAIPDAACLEDHEVVAARERLRLAVSDERSPLFVRVSFDESARVKSICLEQSNSPGRWSKREALARRVDEIEGLETEVACLAGKRLDFNRRSAVTAAIKRRRLHCFSELAEIKKGGSGVNGPEFGTVSGQNQSCENAAEDWIELGTSGMKRPIIFVKPEVVNPPGPNARETRIKCFKTRDVTKRAKCLLDNGWQVLE